MHDECVCVCGCGESERGRERVRPSVVSPVSVCLMTQWWSLDSEFLPFVAEL